MNAIIKKLVLLPKLKKLENEVEARFLEMIKFRNANPHYANDKNLMVTYNAKGTIYDAAYMDLAEFVFKHQFSSPFIHHSM
jgi:hypothetical protein